MVFFRFLPVEQVLAEILAPVNSPLGPPLDDFVLVGGYNPENASILGRS